MIRSFKNRPLQQLYESGSIGAIPPEVGNKISRILLFLDSMDDPRCLHLPFWRLRSLKGARKGQWCVGVMGSHCIRFRFDAGNAEDVDLVEAARGDRPCP